MSKNIPHLVQYQGSKRILAPQILSYMPRRIKRLVEPFSGMAAITIAAAAEMRANQYHLNDLNAPLIALLQEAIEKPTELLNEYSRIWKDQFCYKDDHVQHFYFVREKFNNGEESPANMLYLLARCVKGAVRYGKNGKFNQSPDKRRHGMTPQKLEQNLAMLSSLLKGKTFFSSLDYREILENAKPGDLIYMDPPYQGVSYVRDNRYFAGVSFDDFAKSIEVLDRKGVDYLISYDGMCGEKGYGRDLPSTLNCSKVLLNAGCSSQATLMGQHKVTYEALYFSDSLKKHFVSVGQLPLWEKIA